MGRRVSRIFMAAAVLASIFVVTLAQEPLPAAAAEPAERAEWAPLRGTNGVTCTWGDIGAPDNVCTLNGAPYHTWFGIDIDTPNDSDQKVYSAGFGEVVSYFDGCGVCASGLGNWVLTYHADDNRTVLYAHLKSVGDSIKSAAAANGPVTPNTVIGIEGDTGFADGDHLHYEEFDGRRESPGQRSEADDPGRMLGIMDGEVVSYWEEWGVSGWSEASWEPGGGGIPQGPADAQFFLENEGCGTDGDDGSCYLPPVTDPEEPPVSIVLVIDASGSMDQNDPQERRIDAAKTYVKTVALLDDEVGVVSFASSVTTRSQAVVVRTESDALGTAIEQIGSSGATDLAGAVTEACNVLRGASGERRAAILLTDGLPTVREYTDQESCFEDDWSLYTIGLGNGVDAPLLERIAANTGGTYAALDSIDDVSCYFGQIRATLVGTSARGCVTASIQPGEIVALTEEVRVPLRQINFSNIWAGSDIEMTLTSPSGRTIDRLSQAIDLRIDVGPTFESMTVVDPEQGTWEIELFGADIPAGGEDFTYSTVQLPVELGDQDGDGIDDAVDNCVDAVNPGQDDSDGDGTGDVCDNDSQDPDPSDPHPDNDRDGDGIDDAVDNCVDAVNLGQDDSDGDGTGDACEAHDGGSLGVRLRGDTGDERFEIRVGGTVVARGEATTDWALFETAIPDSTALADIQVAFVNDAVRGAYDRNLRVDYVEFNGRRHESEAPTTFGTGTYWSSSRCLPAYLGSDALHCNGYFQYSQPEAHDGGSLGVRLRGDTGDERFEIRVGGTVVARGEATTDWALFETAIPDGTALADIQVAFVNDAVRGAYDRNLRVDYVEFNGRRHESEAPTTFGTGTYWSSSRCLPAYLGSDALHCNGYFQYSGA